MENRSGMTDFLREHLINLHKKGSEKFGKAFDETSKQKRVENLKVERKNHRQNFTMGNRNIPVNMSPVTPGAPVPQKEKPGNKRLELLQKWKSEKEQRKAQQVKKPMFKVCHVKVEIGLPKLERVNKEIKGVPIKFNFAPPNHKFKPPANIKPINLNPPKTTVKIEKPPPRMVTRSQNKPAPKPAAPAPIKKEPKTKVVKAAPTKKATTVKGKTKTEIKIEKPPEIQKERLASPKSKEAVIKEEKTTAPESTTERLEVASSDDSDATTPKKEPPGEPPMYLSPFVTILRGKNSAKKQREARIKDSIESPTDMTSPRAGAAYFAWILDQEIIRLTAISEQWALYKTSTDLAEEATSLIDVAIGQTNLLISKKFQQFRGLIDKCKDNTTMDQPVTCEDLHGFWDMVHIQVGNLDARYANLEKLKANHWEEVLPVVVAKAAAKKSRPKPVKSAKGASSGLKAAIAAMRKKKMGEESEDVATVPIVPVTPVNKRKSVLAVERSSRRVSSPGLMMMKVAQYAKDVETPGRSILKREAGRSVKKSVLFIDEVADKENDANETNINGEPDSATKAHSPLRRSSRLTKTKLF